ncbi:hypothetical protein HHK36_022208 [Tetracentron sinense]|uniref:IBH1-like N-terminal domain-containing protein n=1 Tax=Tetracentron sinense TaxID=13715 RepID=A0A834YSG7_TETSI|nr:hypothetical protein HHK36_022208 [Tetracentron sinense]
MAVHRLSLNPSSYKTRFTQRFLRALMKINKNKNRSSTSSSFQEIRRGRRRIKIAADGSMASAVGSKRAWSRAMLYKLRTRTRHQAWVRKISTAAKRKRDVGNKPEEELSRTDDLRRLVPGGEAMDFCSLLEETAHYIKCLTTQAHVMQSIADFYST